LVPAGGAAECGAGSQPASPKPRSAAAINRPPARPKSAQKENLHPPPPVMVRQVFTA